MDVSMLPYLAFVFVVLGQVSSAPHHGRWSFSPIFPGTCGRGCEGKFMCNAGDMFSTPHCLHAHHVCDGVVDCKDGSDERFCSKGCQYKCKGEHKCIRTDQFCDKSTDCCLGEDETHCEYRCLDGWVAFQGSCYYIRAQPRVNYAAAQVVCDDLDSYMVVIESSEENDFIKNIIIDMDLPGIWTGMRRDSSGTLRWTHTEEEPVFDDWAIGEPAVGLDCIGMPKGKNYQWKTGRCETVMAPPVCERRPY